MRYPIDQSPRWFLMMEETAKHEFYGVFMGFLRALSSMQLDSSYLLWWPLSPRGAKTVLIRLCGNWNPSPG